MMPRIAASTENGGMYADLHGRIMDCTHSASLCREIQVNGSARGAVYLRAMQEHVRYKYVAIDTLHGAATAVSDLASDLASSIVGTATAASSTTTLAAERLRLENAILAAGRQAVATARAIHSTNPMEEYDTLAFSCRNALSDLVEATEVVAGRIYAYVSLISAVVNDRFGTGTGTRKVTMEQDRRRNPEQEGSG